MSTTVATDLYLPSPFHIDTSALSLTQIQHNSAAEIFGMVIIVPKTGTLHSFEFLTGGVATNPTNGTRLSFQDVDVTTGRGDTTDDQFVDIPTLTASTWTVPPGPLTDTGLSGGAKRSVTAGQRLACVLKRAPVDTAGDFEARCLAYSPAVPDNGYIYNNTTKFNSAPIMALKYDDGSYVVLPGGTGPITGITTHTFNNTSTPDEIGNRFQVPYGVTVDGVWLNAGPSNDSDVILYASNGTSVLGTFNLENLTKVNNVGLFVGFFDNAPITLAAATTYRIVVKPSSNSNLSIYSKTFPSNAYLACMPMGTSWYKTVRTDAGAWSETDSEQLMMGLHINGIVMPDAGDFPSSGVMGARIQTGY